MLKTIRIENFKAFGSPQDLPLAPITLIYGPNSAGKSSIIQTLLLMHQSLQGISQAATRLVFSGEYVDLGTYLSALFRHESSLRMKLGFSFTAPKPVSRGLTNHVFSRQSIRNIDLTIDLTSSARREKRGDAQIVECNYSLDDGQVFQVKLKRKEESKGSADYNDYDVDKSPSEFQILDKISLVKFAEFISNLSSGKNQRDSKHNKLTNDDSKAPLNRVLIQELKNLKILPIGLLPSRIAFNSEVDSFTTFFDTIGPEISRHLFGPNSPLEVLRKEFHNKIQSISYLGPLRSHPARHYIISGADKETVGTKGERTPQLLYRRKRDMEPRINQKFEDFGINYKIGVESAGTPQTGEIISIVLTDKNGIRVSPSDVGFGIGQLLPILVEGSVSSGRIICVEQPEVHLHPRLQAHIADFLIETAKTRSTTPNRSGSAKEFGGNQWIIETHSEALMLRLQKRIKSGLPPEFVSVLYVEQLDNGQSRVKRLRLDENGEFIDEWPDGFFEEGYNEIFWAELTMVVRFLIDPDALDSDVIDQARSHADHNRLFCEWKRYGVMIMPTDFSTVKTKIEKMPVEQRKQWQIALKDDRFRKAEWNDNSAEHVLADVAAIKSTKDAFDLVCLEKTKAFCFGIPESNISAFLKDDIEICRYDCTDQSASFKKQRDIWNSLVLTGDSVEEVWKKRFLGLTRFGRKISIVDRYSLKNTLENFSNGIFSDLESMLKLVSSAGGPKKKIINMYASDCKTKDFCIEKVRALEVMEKICRTYYGKIASFHLHLAPDAVFQTVAHDRFIRFDGVVTSIGKGISLFRNGNNIDNYACSLMTDDRDEFRTEIEGKLRRSAEYFTIL